MTFWRSCLFALVLLPTSYGWCVDLYGLKSFAPFDLYLIDTNVLGAPSFIGTIGFGPDLTELVRVGPDMLYTVDRTSNTLVTVSTADASVLATVPLDTDVTVQPRGFDLSPTNGMLYGVFPPLQLRNIDPATGATSFVANITGATGVEAIAFGPDGTLYATGNPTTFHPATHVYTLDTTTGALSLLGITGQDIDALTYAPDGYLYGTDSVLGVVADLIQIDPSTGTFTNLGPTGITGFNGIAAEWVTQVSIDIKPGSYPNSVNPHSSGIIRVAILSSAGFDVANIDPSSLLFGPMGAGVAAQPNMQDVDGDGLVDLVSQFRTPETGIQCGDTDGTLKGETWAGSSFQGSDSIRTVGCNAREGFPIDKSTITVVGTGCAPMDFCSRFVPENTVDDDRSTFWSSKNDLELWDVQYLAYDFHQNYKIDRIELFNDFYDAPDQYLLGELEFQWSKNSTNGMDGKWTTFATVPGDFTVGDFGIFPDIGSVRWIRLVMTYLGRGAHGGSPAFYLSEIDFYTRSASNPPPSP